MNQNDIYWAFAPVKVVIYQSMHASDLAGFLEHVQKISRLLSLSRKLIFLQKLA